MNEEMKKTEGNEAAVPVQEKKTLKQKIACKKEEIKQKRAEKKAQNAGKPGIGKKIAAGVGVAALVIGGVAAGIACSKRTDSDEVYDPDEGMEPGDFDPEDFADVEDSEPEKVEE